MLTIEQYSVSNDPTVYEAWPDLAAAADGRLICVFSECKSHGDRSYSRVMLADSFDGGKSWSPKRPLTEDTSGTSYYYNCARISKLSDNRIAVIVDRLPLQKHQRDEKTQEAVVLLFFSSDNGQSWSEPAVTPLRGIVPEKLCELPSGRWLIAAHRQHNNKLAEFLHFSDDKGLSWSEEVTVAADARYNLCEVSLLPMGGNVVAALFRENTLMGWDCQKAVSTDGGEHWSEVVSFPLPGCHRPTAGLLSDGQILITYRFLQGGSNSTGSWMQNLFGALTNAESLLADSRDGASCRIFPIDYDRSPNADLGYSGWVELPDGKVCVVNYIVDDAFDKAQIRAYRFDPKECRIEMQKKAVQAY